MPAGGPGGVGHPGLGYDHADVPSCSPTPHRSKDVFLPCQRDDRIRWLLECHPVTAAMLVQIGWLPSKNRALRRLGRLVQRGRVRLVGTVCRKPGRPENVYCRHRVKADQLLHEVQLSQFCLGLHAGRVLRGTQLEGSAPRADAEAWINGRRFHVEWDRGTMSYAQVVRDRFPHYAGGGDLVLWVCSTEARREGLRGRAAAIRHAGLFATAQDALADPHGKVWLDYGGRRVGLPRQDFGICGKGVTSTNP